jgi:hypothetical protein
MDSWNISNDVPPYSILLGILRASVDGFSNPEFFERFHSTNEYIDKRAERFLDSLDNNPCPFQLLHGYSKNGKTTFIQYVRYLNNRKDLEKRFFRYIIHTYDFEKGGAANYIVKIKNIFNDHFRIDDPSGELKVLQDIHHFIRFYKLFITALFKLKTGTHDPVTVILTYFHDFCSHLIDRLESIVELTTIGTDGNYKNANLLFQRDIIENINEINCGDYFSFLILFELFMSRYSLLKKEGKPHKIIFVLDNIDDYLVDKDILFFKHPQIQLSTFINNLTRNDFISNTFSECLRNSMENDERFSRNIVLRDQIRIVYVFRTANFFVFSNILQQKRKEVADSAERNFPECLLDRRYIKYKTVRNTNEILKKRLDLFESIASEKQINIPRGFLFLKYLTENYYTINVEDNKKESDNIFRIWNGDKQAICKHIFDYWDRITEDFFNYEEVLLNLNNSKFYDSKYLLKGVYIYFFLKLLDYDPQQAGFIDSIFHYKMSYEKEKKSLHRFILNYIINKSTENGKPTTISEIRTKGIGLLDLLSEITNLIKDINKVGNKEIFSKKDVEIFFKNLYSKKIDYFSHFFTIYKSQIVREDASKEMISNYYNLNTELESFYNDEYEGLNDIRIYNNDNASYFSLYLITHYELFSFCESHDDIPKLKIKKPLLFTLNKNKRNEGSAVIEDFEFYTVIEHTLKAAEISVNGMVDFYIKYLIYKYPPNKFVDSQIFSVKTEEKGDFQFRLLISRHFTYLESFRRGIMEDILLALPDDEKIMVNLYLTNAILAYINLFKTNYNKIAANINGKIDCDSLNKTMNAYLICENLANKIIDSKGSDFATIIKSIP